MARSTSFDADLEYFRGMVGTPVTPVCERRASGGVPNQAICRG
jgi:hypothetical protein